jgi:hypothetical protein
MSGLHIIQRSQLGRRVGFLVAAVVTVVVTAGASFAPPDDDLVTRVLTDPAGTLGQMVEDAGLAQPVAAGEQLKGVFKLDPASCKGGAATGTYFRMIQPGGGQDGPWVENNDSACADKSYTDLAPGKDGGLSTMGHQPNPDPAFDATGSGTNDRITQPRAFYGTKFSTSTNPKDPQTGGSASVPTVTNENGKLSGNLAAFAAAWNNQHFNQGSPKPDNSTPGLTSGPSGTYDPGTKHFVLEWASTIVGGAFNNFTGRWHFEGTFQPGGGKAAQKLAAPDESPAPSGRPLPVPVPGVSSPRPAPARVTVAQASAGALKGLFRLSPASCSGPQVSGTYFRMIQPGGTKDGPWVSNNDSTCADKGYTDLAPGKDGGLSTTGFQPHPSAPFDATGSGTNDRITQPKGFFGAKFSTATNEKDPQTGGATKLPEIVYDGAGKLSGNLSAFAAAWNGQHFNQGSPKPDGSKPGLTSGPEGTFDPATRKFTIEWTTTIVGGPFNNFTGKWHFEGVYEGTLPAAVTAPTTSGGSTSGGSTSGGSTTSRATTPAVRTAAAAPSTTSGAAMANTGLRLPPTLPAALIGLGLISRRLSRRPRARR